MSRKIRASPSAAAVVAAGAHSARAAGLIHVSDDGAGIRRRRARKGFVYHDDTGRRISDARVLARIRSLAIPPAYSDVWICPHPHGHIQATGRDARSRKQYRYHARWRVVRDDGKFTRLAAFGAALPRLRRCLRRDLARPGLPGDKVLAVVVSLLADTLARVGNENYARENGSFGLTTLRSRHVGFVRGGRVMLRFRGKGGREHEVVVDDARLARIVRRCRQLPGQQLFQYVDDEGRRRPIDSGMVNAYLSEAMGADFTAKDFRTWGATLHAVALLARTGLPAADDERAVAAATTGVVREVATVLRNTPAVCRSSYIDPRVFEAWRNGRLQRLAAAGISGPRQLEKVLLALLRPPRRTRASRSARA